MQYAIARLTLVSLLALAAAACDDDDDVTGPDDAALLRVVNAAPVADVQVRVVGTATPLASDLDFRGSTQTCVEVPDGEQALVFSSSGVELATTAFTFERGLRYTAILVASGPTRRAVVLDDNEIVSTANNGLRFINATPSPGDVYVTAPGGAVLPTFLVDDDLAVLATSNDFPPYFDRSIDHTQVRLFDVGTTTGTPRADFALTGLPANRLATVVFTPATPTAFMVIPCP